MYGRCTLNASRCLFGARNSISHQSHQWSKCKACLLFRVEAWVMFWAHFGLLQQFPHVGLFRWPFWIQVASTEKSPKRFGQSSSIFKRDKQKFWILKSSHVEFSLSAWQKPWKLQAFIHFTLYEIARINGLTTVQLTPSVVSRWSHDPTLCRSYSDQSLSCDEKSSDLSEKAHFAAMGQNGKESDSVEAFSAN